MRKLYLLLVLSLFVGSLIAQVPINAWYNPEKLLRNTTTGPFEKKVNIVFPDSSVVIIDKNNKTKNVAFHAWGHLFDLRHVAWEAASNKIFDQRDNYTWDSLAFNYIYRRNNPNPNIIDTCFVTYYKNNSQNQFFSNTIRTYCWVTGYDTMLYAKPKILDRHTLAGTEFYKRDTILLNRQDTTTISQNGWESRSLAFHVGTIIEGTNSAHLSINPKSWFGVTITFKPGYNWNKGDTIESFGSKKPFNGGNYFGFQYTTEALGNDQCFPHDLINKNYADNSIILHKSTRYGQIIYSGFEGFLFGSLFNELIFADVKAKVSGISTVSVKEVEELGLSLGKVYPNPANTGQSIFIEYAVKNATNVTIGVYDMLGKKVATVLDNERVEAGENATETTLNLNPGVYFYTLSSGNTAINSQKFTVIR
ncbi:MAG: T9SS type A sorting domain-containing protein [bacterium]